MKTNKNFKKSLLSIIILSGLALSSNAYAVSCEATGGRVGVSSGYSNPDTYHSGIGNFDHVNRTFTSIDGARTISANNVEEYVYDNISDQKLREISFFLGNYIKNLEFNNDNQYLYLNTLSNFTKEINSRSLNNEARFHCTGIIVSGDNATNTYKTDKDYLVKFAENGSVEDISELVNEIDFTGKGIKDSDDYHNHLSIVGEDLKTSDNTLYKNISTETRVGKNGKTTNDLVIKLNQHLKNMNMIEFTGGNNNPVTISNNGLDNGNNKILNVANGEVSASSKDAINGSQLFAELDQLNLRLTNLKNELSSQPSQPSTPSQPFNLTVKGDSKEESVGNGRKLAFDNGKNTTAKITITKDNDVSVKFDLNEDIRDLNSMEFKSGIAINNTGLSMANKKITNLAEGEVSATSKDGVNGSQLFATNEEVKKNKAQITIIKNDLDETKKQVAKNKQDIENLENNFIELVDNATNINVENWRNKLGIKDSERDGDFVEYTTNEDGSKVINLYDNNGEGTLITNVADGKIAPDSKDAVNGSQLYKLERNINNKIDYLDNKIDQVEKNVNGGIANAIAMGSIPQVWQNGKGLLGVGVGNSQGVNSVAVGYSQASDNGKMIFKLNASINTNKKANFGAGFGYQF